MWEIGARSADRFFFWLFVIHFSGAKFSASLSAEIAHQASDTLLTLYESAAPRTVDKPTLSVSSDHHQRLSLHPVPIRPPTPGSVTAAFNPSHVQLFARAMLRYT